MFLLATRLRGLSVRNNNRQFSAIDSTLYLHYEGAEFELWPEISLF